MTWSEKAAILLEMIAQLQQRGSWCGHTHMQKAVYFLQELFGNFLGYRYVLYMYGPYSFDLVTDLLRLRADYLVGLDYKVPGYGPGMVITEFGQRLRQRLKRVVERHRPVIEFVAQCLAAKNVAELERLATALYVTRTCAESTSLEQRAEKLVELKPRLTVEDALKALREVDDLLAKSKAIK
ncbi:MAG: hypothetical protein RMI91_06425 [Gemmatales bacterium]|nr:hypothetical protein [Gemmatales bacterium]MDW7994271.1 hypothetical protein [Gemmatales bacterium]